MDPPRSAVVLAVGVLGSRPPQTNEDPPPLARTIVP
jgi:hypothetical protein